MSKNLTIKSITLLPVEPEIEGVFLLPETCLDCAAGHHNCFPDVTCSCPCHENQCEINRIVHYAYWLQSLKTWMQIDVENISVSEEKHQEYAERIQSACHEILENVRSLGVVI
jgi:hypothetical protein